MVFTVKAVESPCWHKCVHTEYQLFVYSYGQDVPKINLITNNLAIFCSCWMSVEKGTIFAFVVPVLVIILVI